MSVALPVPSVAVAPASVAAGPPAADAANSGQSFSDALSNELGAGDTPPVTAGREAAPAEPATPMTGKATDAATLATGGNSLPPPLPPEAMLTLAMQVAGATPNPVAADTPAGTPAPATSPRTDAAPAGSSDAAPAIVPAAALAAAPFVLPAAGSADSPADSGSAATATTTATPAVTAAKPSLSAQHVAAALNSQNLTAAGASSVEVDPSVVATKAVAESISALADGPKAAATPARAEPVIDTSSLVVPTHGNGESVAALTSAPAPAGTGGTVSGATVSVPFGQSAWGQAFGNQVVWAVNQGLPTAALHLSPPELGPVSVHIRLDQDQASIAFSSPHAAVRDAIDAAMPRLRDMLGSQGIALVDVNVSQHGSSQAHPQARDHAPGGGRATESQDPAAVPVSPIRQAVLGVLDLYA